MKLLQNIIQYISDFIKEAPWYFWVYTTFTPIGLLALYYDKGAILTLIPFFIYPILLKKYNLLRTSHLYWLPIITLLIINIILEYVFQKYNYEYSIFFEVFSHNWQKIIKTLSSYAIILPILFFAYKKVNNMQYIVVLLMSYAIIDFMLIIHMILSLTTLKM